MIINKNEIVKRYAQGSEEKYLLARVLDKLEESEKKNILTFTRFLNEQQKILVGNILRNSEHSRHHFFGGYQDARRAVLIFLPDYLELEHIMDDKFCPVSLIRIEYSPNITLSNRDFLGSLMGTGIIRETVGDILVGDGSCDIVVLKEIAPYLLANVESVGRVKIKAYPASLKILKIPEEKYLLIQDTVASLRLDNVVSSGFSLSRSKAGEFIKAGRVSFNSLECTKLDKPVNEGDAIALRGKGKINIQNIGNKTKKGRTVIIVKKYI